MRTLRQACSLLILCSALLVACSSPFSSVKSPTPSPTPTTAWQRLLGHIHNGNVDLPTALQLFSMAFGPLPGVQTPSGPIGDIDSGTIAIDFIGRHWAELTAQQQQAVSTAISSPFAAGSTTTITPTAAKPSVLPSALPLARAAHAVAPNDYPAIVSSFIAFYTKKLGRSLPFPVMFSQTPPKSLLDKADGAPAFSFGFDETGVYPGGDGKKVAVCGIFLDPARSHKDVRTDTQHLAHEVFHCFEYALFPNRDTQKPVWLTEGEARWAGITATIPDSNGAYDVDWLAYFDTPEKPLPDRSYDAVGFYALLAQVRSVDEVWKTLDPMLLAATDTDAATVAITLGGEPFLNAWASSYGHQWGRDFANQKSWGPDWDIKVGSFVDTHRSLAPIIVGKAGHTATAAPLTATLEELEPISEVVTFAVSGHARFHDEGTLDVSTPDGLAFCASKSGCTCPPGSAYAGRPLAQLTGHLFLGVTGGSGGASVTVTGMDLKEFCSRPEKKPLLDASGSCNRMGAIGAGTSNPDPISVTGTCQYTFSPHKRFAAQTSALVLTAPLPINLFVGVDENRACVDAGNTGTYSCFALDAYGPAAVADLDPYLVWNYNQLPGATVMGSDVVNGIATQHLRGSAPAQTIDVWIAKDTGYPVKWVDAYSSNGTAFTETIILTQWNTGINITIPS